MLALTLAASPAAARPVTERSAEEQYVMGLGSLLVTPVYGALKLALATAGGVVGTLTWLFTGGDNETAGKVWDTTVKGTYVISPEHLAGERPIHLTGGGSG